MEITFSFEDNVKPIDIARKLRMQAGLLEGLTGREASSVENTDDEEAPARPIKTGLKRQAAAVVEDEFEDEISEPETSDDVVYDDPAEMLEDMSTEIEDAPEESFDDDEIEAAPVKKKAAAAPAKVQSKGKKKITIDDVNDACRKLALKIGGKPGREKVLGILQKKFKTKTVSALKPEQYADVLAALK